MEFQKHFLILNLMKMMILLGIILIKKKIMEEYERRKKEQEVKNENILKMIKVLENMISLSC